MLPLPLSLYVHYPWCVRKCPYCDFNSYKGGNDDERDRRYFEILLQDLASLEKQVANRPFVSVFFGGGTPSLCKSTIISAFLENIRDRLEYNCEITIEANPGTVNEESLHELREAGVNRISIGVQSFEDRLLKKLGRIHDATAARSAVQAAVRAGFTRINVDLMHGLPSQSVKEALNDIREAALLGATHLSWYELTIEEDTAFGQNPPKLPDEAVLGAIEDQGFALIQSLGFKRYEVSAFTKAEPCRHNLNYWQFYDYVGLGAGAHSKFMHEGATYRRACPSDPKLYLKGDTGQILKVEKADLPFEFMLNRLRIFSKVSFDEYQRTTALLATDLLPTLKQAETMGLLTLDDMGFELTSHGRLMLNDVLEMFL